MAAQDDINAANQAFSGLLSDLSAQAGTLVNDLTVIQGRIDNGLQVDTTALNATVASAQQGSGVFRECLVSV